MRGYMDFYDLYGLYVSLRTGFISLSRAGLSSTNIGVKVQRFKLFFRLFGYFPAFWLIFRLHTFYGFDGADGF